RIDAGDPLGLRAHDLHVFETGAAVFGRDVVTAQILDEATERAEQRDAIEVALRPDDHALATTVRETRERGLVRHAAREPQRIDDSGFVCVVLDEAAAA